MPAQTRPDPTGPHRIASQLGAFFLGSGLVERVLVFGSLGRSQSDRWSDVDLLLITRENSETAFRLFAALHRRQPIVWHGAFDPNVEPAGASVLGMVLQGAPVFHKLDLNFMNRVDCEVAANLERFGETQELSLQPDDHFQSWLPTDELLEELRERSREDHSTEWRLWSAMHPVHGAVKQVLRGQASPAQLRDETAALQQALQEIPENLLLPGGDLRSVAQTWLQIADACNPARGGRRICEKRPPKSAFGTVFPAPFSPSQEYLSRSKTTT